MRASPGRERGRMIILKDVNKIYGKGDGAVHALKDVNVVIEDGKFTAILGRAVRASPRS